MTSETLIGGLPGAVQCVQPLTSSAPPSCPLVDSEREGGTEPALNHGLQAPAREPEGSGKGKVPPAPG